MSCFQRQSLKRKIYHFFLKFQACFLLQFWGKKKSGNFFSWMFWLVFVKSWDYFRLTFPSENKAISCCCFVKVLLIDSALPLSPLERSKLDIPQGHSDLLLVRHEFIAWPSSFPLCLALCPISCVVPHPSVLLTPYFTSLFSSAAPLRLESCSLFPASFLSRLPSLLQAPPSAQAFPALRTHMEEKEWEFFSLNGSLVTALFQISPSLPHTHSVGRSAADGEYLLK